MTDDQGAVTRTFLVAFLVIALLGGLGWYVQADLRGEVPGWLTTDPAPQPYPTIEPAPAATPVDLGAPALAALPVSAGPPDPAAASAALAPLLADPALGPSVGATVVDADTGQVLLDSSAAAPHEPASVTKVLTSAAALTVLGPDTTLDTTVVGSPGSDQITLVAGGDVLLAAGESDPDAVNGRAGLDDLAAQTAAALQAQNHPSVRVYLDDSILGGLGWDAPSQGAPGPSESMGPAGPTPISATASWHL